MRTLKKQWKPLTPADVLANFMPRGEQVALRTALRGEEGKWMKQKLDALTAMLNAMPTTGQQDGKGDKALVYRHYFGSGCDWWILELDVNPGQHQAFGFACLGDPQCAELGYISIPELLSVNAEVDLYWTPTTLGAIKTKLKC